MKLEIVEFYKFAPNPERKDSDKCTMLGTLHVFLIDYNIDIRGIHVYKRKKGIFFMIPSQVSYDIEEKKNVKYPIINFIKAEEKKEFFDLLFKLAPKFIYEKERKEKYQTKRKIPGIKPSFIRNPGEKPAPGYPPEKKSTPIYSKFQPKQSYQSFKKSYSK